MLAAAWDQNAGLEATSPVGAALERVAALGKDTAGSYFLRAIALDKVEQKAAALENYQHFLATDEQKNQDQEFQARQRVRALEREVRR